MLNNLFKSVSFILVVTLVSCAEDSQHDDFQQDVSDLEHLIIEQTNKHGVSVSENDLDKILQIYLLAEEYGLDTPSQENPNFFRNIETMLKLEMEEIEGFFRELQAHQILAERTTEVTRKWMPKFEAASNKEEHDSLYTQYQQELSELREKIMDGIEIYSNRIFSQQNTNEN